jgi:hypothetical protein
VISTAIIVEGVETLIVEVGMNEGGRSADEVVAGIAEIAEGVMVDISGVVKILQANSILT